MKSAALTKWSTLFFLLGVLVGSASVVFINHGRDKEGPTQSGKDCDRDIDLGIAQTLMQAVPLHSKVLQLIQSNQLLEAQTDLCLYAMTEMKSAWDISEHYEGALKGDLNPLLLDAYPPIRRVVGATAYARWPKPAFLEMSNFIAQADSFVQRERNTNQMGSTSH